jgi:hypothetical protein
VTDDAKTPAERAYLAISTSPATAETYLAVIHRIGIGETLALIGVACDLVPLARHFGNVIDGKVPPGTGRKRCDDRELLEMVQRLIAKGWRRSAALHRAARLAEVTMSGSASSHYKRLDKKLHALEKPPQ